MTAAAQTPAKRRSLRPAWLRGYDRAVLRADVIAGVIVAAVLIPQAMAYATLANLPPIVGLYAAAAAPLFYPLLASSRRLAVGRARWPRSVPWPWPTAWPTACYWR